MISALVLTLAIAPDRARDLGIPFDGEPGPLNAITDVAGVTVAHKTIVRGEDEGAIRTGATVVMPRPTVGYLHAGVFVLSGDAEVNGAVFANEMGLLRSPIVLTGTGSVGRAYTGVMRWSKERWPEWPVYMPVVADTMDDILSDIGAFPLTEEDVMATLDSVKAGAVEEGSVGGGTGMVAFGFKAGIGTSSRTFKIAAKEYTAGVLVQANFGRRSELRIAGRAIGRSFTDLQPVIKSDPPGEGSCVIVIATDAPLGPLELQQVARRASLGLARLGSSAATQSGELAIAFSTQHVEIGDDGKESSTVLAQYALDPLYLAVIRATEEAVVNALVAGRTMTGFQGNMVYGIPQDRLRREFGGLP